MEYTGPYFNNAQTYDEWTRDLPEGVQFAGALNVLHDPALWGNAETDQSNSPISYVHQNYAHIMPTEKIVGLGVGCHPKFCDYERYDEATYNVERVEADLDRIFITEVNPTFHGKVPMVVGECGLEHGISRNEEGKPFKKPRAAQIEMIKAHIRIAKRYKKPIMLHIRGKTFEEQEALERHAIAIFEEMEWDKDLSIIHHSFSGGPDTAAEWMQRWEKTYFSFSLASRGFPESAQFMNEYEPELKHVIIETDAPLLSRDVPGNRGLRPNDSRRKPAHSNDLLKVIERLHDERVEFIRDIEVAIREVSYNVFEAYDMDQQAVIDALDADVTPTENPRDWQTVFPTWRTGIPRRRQRQDPHEQQQRPQNRPPAGDPSIRQAGRSGSSRRTAEEARPHTGRWRRAESPRRPNRAQFPRRAIPTETPLTLRPLPQLPEAIPRDRRERISTRDARRALLIQADNRSSTGLEMFRECKEMHKDARGNPICNGTTVRRQFPSFEDSKLDTMGLSPEERSFAHKVRDMEIPSLLHLVLIEWAVRIPASFNNRYRLIAQLIGNNAQTILYLWEEYLLAHSDDQFHPLAREYIFAAVHKWSFCCKPLQDDFKKRKPVGNLLYMVRAPPDATAFLRDAVKFIAQNIPTGIDNNRVERLARGGAETERTVINSTVLFVGDSVAAALASCCTVAGSQYAQMYYWSELHAFLDNVYFGHQVLTVVISIGRADLPQYESQKGVSVLEKLVKNYLRQLLINFPHVAFYFFFPPYDHGQKELWLEHVMRAYNGNLAYPQKVKDALLDFPDAFRDHPNRFRTRAPQEDEEVDANGNLTRLGLQMVIGGLQQHQDAPFAQFFNPEAQTAPLRGGPLREARFYDSVPRRQHNPPIGPADLTYEDSEEPTYLASFPDDAPAGLQPPVGLEETPSKSPPRQRPRIDAQSTTTVNSRSGAPPLRDPRRNLTLDYSKALVEPPAATDIPVPPAPTQTSPAVSDVVVDLTGRADTAQILARVAQMAFDQANAANAPGQLFQRIVITAGTASFTLDASPTAITYLLGHGLLQLAAAPRQ